MPAARCAKPVPLGARRVGRPQPPTAQRPARRMRSRSAEPRRRASTRVTRVRGDESSPSWAPDNSASRSTPCATASDRSGSRAVEPPPRRPNEEPQSAAATRVRRRSWCRGWAARPRGRRTAARCWSPACPIRSRSTTAIPLRNAASRRRCLRRSRHFSCGACRAAAGPRGRRLRRRPSWRRRRRSMRRRSTRAWQTLRDLYYSTGPAADAWTRLRDKYQAARGAGQERRGARRRRRRDGRRAAADQAGRHSRGAVVVSGHPLASEAGASRSRRAATSSTR